MNRSTIFSLLNSIDLDRNLPFPARTKPYHLPELTLQKAMQCSTMCAMHIICASDFCAYSFWKINNLTFTSSPCSSFIFRLLLETSVMSCCSRKMSANIEKIYLFYPSTIILVNLWYLNEK